MAITELQYTGINVWWFKVLMKMLLFSTVPITSRAWQMLVWVDISTGKLHTFLMATFEWTIGTINDSAWSSLQNMEAKRFFFYTLTNYFSCVWKTQVKNPACWSEKWGCEGEDKDWDGEPDVFLKTSTSTWAVWIFMRMSWPGCS